MASHHQLLAEAKERQQECLRASLEASQQLDRTMRALVLTNSTAAAAPHCAPVLDKIATIHQLDAQIDRQLDQVGDAYGALAAQTRRLRRLAARCQHALDPAPRQRPSVPDALQRRAEIADQNLRILETTLALVQRK